MFKSIIIFLMITLANWALSDEIQVVGGLKTWHYVEGNWCEDNEFIGVRYRDNSKPVYLELSRFINSYCTESYTIGIARDYELDRVYQYSFYTGFSTGLVKGYEAGQIFGLPVGEDTSVYFTPYIRFMYNDIIGLQHRPFGLAGTIEAVFSYKF